MSNYYYRDDEGNWFVRSSKRLIPVDFSASMEIAYTMGKLIELKKQKNDLLKELKEKENENLM